MNHQDFEQAAKDLDDEADHDLFGGRDGQEPLSSGVAVSGLGFCSSLSAWRLADFSARLCAFSSAFARCARSRCDLSKE